MPHVLVVEDDPNCLYALAALAELEGFSAATATTLAEARQQVGIREPNLILLDVMLPDGSGMSLLKDLESLPSIQAVMITGHATLDYAVDAFRLGAYDFLTKPLDISHLKSLLAGVAKKSAWALSPTTVVDNHSVAQPAVEKIDRPTNFGLLLGASPAMQKVYEHIKKVAPTEATVLLTGESGTGKDVVAETIHRLSNRQPGPFLPLNCGAISPSLIESELFGHERGSFTGASRLHKGYFERAHGGTLFLDEIAEMPLELQVKLLRVLETGKIMRIGGDRQVEIDVRVIAATNRSLEEAVSEGKFREDLVYRLRVFPIHMPPLRERGADIDLLIQHFTRQFNVIENLDKRFAEAALAKLRTHSWPGNIRELKNVVYRSYIMAEETIELEHLPAEMADGAAIVGPDLHLKVGSSIAEVELRLIVATLEKFLGNKPLAAEILGISLKTLYNRLNEHNLLCARSSS